MGKFLVILSIILTAASAVLGYLNRSKLEEARKSLIDSETAGNQAKTQLAKAQGDLKTVSQERDTAVSTFRRVAARQTRGRFGTGPDGFEALGRARGARKGQGAGGGARQRQNLP